MPSLLTSKIYSAQFFTISEVNEHPGDIIMFEISDEKRRKMVTCTNFLVKNTERKR